MSFHQGSFESYGKEQGQNAPVSQSAAFAYTTALKHLLARDSNQRFQVGDTSTVFWANGECDLERFFTSFWSESPKNDPEQWLRAVKALYKSSVPGAVAATGEQTRFFVLGVAPNVARLSVRFWIQGTAEKFRLALSQHFTDLSIEHEQNEKSHLPLFRLLIAVASQGETGNIPPKLAGDMMQAILSGTLYPVTLLQACVRRIRSDQSVSYARAALLKAYINRKSRFLQQLDEDLKVFVSRAKPA